MNKDTINISEGKARLSQMELDLEVPVLLKSALEAASGYFKGKVRGKIRMSKQIEFKEGDLERSFFVGYKEDGTIVLDLIKRNFSPDINSRRSEHMVIIFSSDNGIKDPEKIEKVRNAAIGYGVLTGTEPGKFALSSYEAVENARKFIQDFNKD